MKKLVLLTVLTSIISGCNGDGSNNDVTNPIEGINKKQKVTVDLLELGFTKKNDAVQVNPLLKLNNLLTMKVNGYQDGRELKEYLTLIRLQHAAAYRGLDVNDFTVSMEKAKSSPDYTDSIHGQCAYFSAGNRENAAFGDKIITPEYKACVSGTSIYNSKLSIIFDDIRHEEICTSVDNKELCTDFSPLVVTIKGGVMMRKAINQWQRTHCKC